MRPPLNTLASAFLLGLLALQARPACAMDTPGRAAQAPVVLQHLHAFQDDPRRVYLLGGAFDLAPGQLQVLINGHPLDPGQVTRRSGCCLAVARSAWDTWVAPRRLHPGRSAQRWPARHKVPERRALPPRLQA